MATIELTLERLTKNRLNPDITRRKLRAIAAIAERHAAGGFSAKVGRLEEPSLVLDSTEGIEAWKYEALIKVRGPQDGLGHVVSLMEGRATTEGWKVVDKQEGECAASRPPEERAESPFSIPDLTEEALSIFFGGVYERDAHIRIIHAAVQNAIESGGKVRSHVLLYGEPGACKTKLTESFKAFLEAGDEVERVLHVDGTTMTKAGLERWLIQLAQQQGLPDVLVMDELEKQPMDNLLALNSVMGSGVLTRLNAKTGNLRLPANFVVVGICNDENSLKSFRGGSLWSRFCHRLYCPRPSRELCEKILLAEAARLPGGKPAWAKAALDFGWDTLGQRDIRELKGHLDGRDGLLSGNWQTYVLATRKSEGEQN
jgi:hypothetical protein